MSIPDDPDRKDDGPAVSTRYAGAGRSARPGDIGEEFGGDLDFEPDALLDSLLAEPLPSPGPVDAPPTGATATSPSDPPPPVAAPAVEAGAGRRPPAVAPPRPGGPAGSLLTPPGTVRIQPPRPAPQRGGPGAGLPRIPPRAGERPLPPPRVASRTEGTAAAPPPPPRDRELGPEPGGATPVLDASVLSGARSPGAPRPSDPAAEGDARELPEPLDPGEYAGAGDAELIDLEDGTALLEELAEEEEPALPEPAPRQPAGPGLADRKVEPAPATTEPRRVPAVVADTGTAMSTALGGRALADFADDEFTDDDYDRPTETPALVPFMEDEESTHLFGGNRTAEVAQRIPESDASPAPAETATVGGGSAVPPAAEADGPWVDEDPIDGLESLPPSHFADGMTADADVLGAIGWDDERPAATFLSERGELAEFAQRAAWLEGEATATRDPSARSRGLLLASELWALCGELERSRDAAEQAVKTAPGMPLGTRQVRWLASLSGDQRFASTALEIETRASASVDARLHAACLNAELRRIAFGDAEGALQRADLAARIDPKDPRPHLLRVVHHLGEASGPSRQLLQSLSIPADPGLMGLRTAVHQIARRRGLVPDQGEPPIPAVAFEDARRALSHGDASTAANALETLARVEGLERGALWLAASLLAHTAANRSEAGRLLSALADDARTTRVTWAQLTRALESGEADGVASALAATADDGSFSAADRVALGALAGSPVAAFAASLGEIAEDPTLLPLAQAAAGAAGARDANVAEAAATRLGRALGDDDLAELTDAHDGYLVDHGESALARVLGVELGLLARDPLSLAMQVAAWPASADDPTGARDRQIVAGMLLASANRPEEARAAFEAALAADPTCEMLARVLAESDDPDDAAARLVLLAERNEDETKQALLLVEAALRTGKADATYEALLRRAAETQPDLPFAAHLGEVSARRRGDVDAVVEWLRLRRLAATDAYERALDATREALLVADASPELATRLIQEALAARPNDVGLHALAERMAPAPSPTHGQWRENLAASVDDAAARTLLTVASLEYELSEAPEDAYRCAREGAARGSALAAVTADRLARTTSGADALRERLVQAARESTDPVERGELHARLADLARATGDVESALSWARAAVEDDDTNLVALRRLEHDTLAFEHAADLEPVASRLALVLERAEAIAHAQTAARLRAQQGRWGEARELVQAAYRHGDPGHWTLRQLSAQARFVGDDEEQLVADRQLLERATRAIDAATLALRASEVAARLGRLDEARALLGRAVEMLPEHLVALTSYAEVLEAAEAFDAAAGTLESLAQCSQVNAHRVAAWHQAGVLWQDRVGDPVRARAAFEQAARLEPTHDDVFRRLQALFIEAGDRAALAELIEQRLANTSDPEERVRLEITRGRALAEVGDRAAARSALAAALDASPDHLDALAAYADLCAADADWPGAEQAWIRLARHSAEPARQAEVYRRLGALYDADLPNPQRAELAYLEVLKRHPGDVDATRRLVDVYGRLGQPERAVELQAELVNSAEAPEDKRDRTLELALVYESIVADRKQAEATLDRARKAWPHDGHVLRALAAYYERQGETKSLQVLLERAANDARRALHTGRFDPAFFDVLASVAEIRGNTEAARVAQATVAALAGDPATLDGAGPAAGDASLDDLLAPDLITLPLRVLLRQAGARLDHAFPFDTRAVRASPLPPDLAGYSEHANQVAQAFGLGEVEVLVTGALGPVCIPSQAAPGQLVFGQALLESGDDAARFFLLLRNLKILQANGAAIARAAPIDLLPMVGAFLHTLCPTWSPTGVDARRLEEHKQRLGGQLSAAEDPDVAALAMEVAGSLGARASQLGIAIHQWGNRAALLAIGDLDTALRAVAMAQGHASGPPPSGMERMKWITRNPEARDLAVFSVSEAYAEARQRLGLG